MRIRTIDPNPFHTLPYLNAARGGGVEVVPLPFQRGVVDRMPEGTEAIVVAADLQGRALYPDQDRLVGEVVAEELLNLVAAGELPEPDRIGILLAGDLWGVLGRRGGMGDVRPVWQAFVERFRWVAGVAGNHDAFGHGRSAMARFRDEPGINLLDEDAVRLDGLNVAGVSGIIGNPRKLQRKWPEDFSLAVQVLIEAGAEVLVLHQGPDAPNRQGHAEVHEAILEARRPVLVVCGHRHWRQPLASLANGTQVLNVDHRVVVLTEPRDCSS